MSAYRPIAPMPVPGITPGGADMPEPVFDRADPTTLLVDESYQRNLSERSVSLIRRLVAKWDWRGFKPPVVVRTSGGLHVIDGQHTAIAAATHPAIATIPIMLVEAPDLADRARAFISHNRDRIAVTPNQMHFAAVAAGDADALTIDQVCARAGLRILKQPPGTRGFKPGDTLAIAAVAAVVSRHGALKARKMLQVLGEAKLAPVPMAAIKAVESIMTDPRLKDIDPGDITTVLRGSLPTLERDGKMFAASNRLPMWKGFAEMLTRKVRRGHRGAA